jgi:hypothetical protein
MTLRKQTVVETLLTIVHHRDERIRHARSFDQVREQQEQHVANELMRDKFAEFVDELPKIAAMLRPSEEE